MQDALDGKARRSHKANVRLGRSRSAAGARGAPACGHDPPSRAAPQVLNCSLRQYVPEGRYQWIPWVNWAKAICSGESCAAPSFLPAAAAESGNMLKAVLSRICVNFGAMA
jgi:hypothetical protein